jgi:hypothetical protein
MDVGPRSDDAGGVVKTIPRERSDGNGVVVQPGADAKARETNGNESLQQLCLFSTNLNGFPTGKKRKIADGSRVSRRVGDLCCLVERLSVRDQEVGALRRML